MGYSNVAGDLNVYGTTTLSSLRMNGPVTAQGITSTGVSNFTNIFASNLTVTNAFIVTATNTQLTNSLSIVNQGTATALYVNQNEFPNMMYNVAEFWDYTQLAMVIDGYGNVAIHQASSPGYAFTVVDGALIDRLTLGAPLAISSGGTGTATGATRNYVFAGPSSGSAGAPLFRALVNADLPSIISVSNVYANGSGLSTLNSSNLVGNVANANVALVVSQTSQPNITSVGLLTNLAVSNSLTTSNLFLSGTANISVANIANIYTTNIVGFIGSQWTSGSGNVYYLSNVGIGTSSVSANLTVVGNVYVSNALSTTNIQVSGNVSTHGFLIDGAIGQVGYVPTSQGDGSIQWSLPGGGVWVPGTGNTYYVGNVGIGTSAVSANLTVVGNVYASNALSTGNAFLSGTLNVQGTSNLWVANIANIYTTNIVGFIGSQWTSGTGNVSYLGNVGIGTSLTSANLTVAGNVYVSNALNTTNVFATGNTSTAGFLIQNAPGQIGQVITATGSGAGIQWSSIGMSPSQGYLLTLPTNYSLGAAFTTGTGSPSIQGFHVNLGSFTAEVGQVITSFSISSGFIKFNSTGLYQLTCVFAADQSISKVAVGTTSSSSFPPTVNPVTGYTYVYNVPVGASPAELCTIPLNVTDASLYYFIDAFFVSGATVLYPTRTVSAANTNYGTFVQVAPFGTYLASASGVASGILASCPTSQANLSSVYSTSTYRVSLNSTNGWAVNGVSASAFITPNGNFQVNQSGIYEIDVCLNPVGQTPSQLRVGSFANDSYVPNTTTPLYIYTYAPQTPQDPTTSVTIPLSIQNISNVFFLEVTFTGTVTGNVALDTQSTYVMLKPIGSFYSPLIFPTNTWSQQGSSIYYSYNVGIGTNATPASLTIAGNVYASNALSTGSAFLTGSLNVQGTSNISVANIANIYTTNIFGFIGSQWTSGTGNVSYLGNVGIGTSLTPANLTVTGNAFASNALTTTNIFTNTLTLANATSTINVLGTVAATTFYGALVGSNIGAFSNLYSANALTTTNIFANTLSLANAAASITGNLSVSNALTTTNIFASFVVSNALSISNSGSTYNITYSGTTGSILLQAGTYTFTVTGAGGGNGGSTAVGGSGRLVSFNYFITSPIILQYVIGGAGSSTLFGSGGGGGTYLYDSTNSQFICVAGGGGGGGSGGGAGPIGGSAGPTTAPGSGGGGNAGGGGGGGGGIIGNGTTANAGGGASYSNGSSGGGGHAGGFGGGGGGANSGSSGGGGGGYTGGGASGTFIGGSGGTSFLSASATLLTDVIANNPANNGSLSYSIIGSYINVLTVSNLTILSNVNFTATTANVGTLNVISVANLASLTTNLVATTANVTTLNVISVANLASLTTNLVATTANVGTLNVISVANLASLTTNLTATTANVGTLNVISVANLASLTIPLANVTTANLFVSNVTTLNVSSNIYTPAFSANATNTVFNFDTLTIPYASISSINVASTLNVQGVANVTTLNVASLMLASISISSINVASTLNVQGVANVSNLTATTIYYNEDITRRSPHIQPTTANASAIQGWISWQSNIVSQQSSFWAPASRPIFSNIASGPPSSNAYAGSVAMADGRTLFIPYGASTFGVFNSATNQYSAITPSGAALTPTSGWGNGLYFGGVQAPSGNIVCIPHASGNIGVFEPEGGTFSNILVHNCPSGAFAGGVLDGNSNVTMIPYNSLNVCAYNGSTGLFSNMVQISSTPPLLVGGVLLSTGNILGIPFGSSNLIQYSPTTRTFANITVGLGGFFGGVLTPNGNVVCVPYTAANVVVVNPTTGVASNIVTGASGFMSGILLPNGQVALVPGINSNVGLFNPATLTFANIAPQGGSISNAYVGASLTVDGRVVFCPNQSTNVAVLNSVTPLPSPEYRLVPYVNKL